MNQTAGLYISQLDRFGSGGCFGSLGFQSLLRLSDDGGECWSIGDREVREDLAVSFDTGSLQAFDEAGVGDVLVAACSVDTLCPQTAELTLALLTVAIFVRHRLADSVLGVTEEFRAETAETLGTEQRPLAAGTAGR